ncbi:low molecular weight phosphotyrosine protein phosphatase-like [Sinocyclocheilus anshuiensis]|uniref:low molecular weight phosphotyrosine protein phosphatase-like n=1 Tax=Sinocyclocheilus anshuiensis TaxID=1608454 RepID=UPI0007B9F7FC|nr:PREDICTED: low molecular weight phosphotyrosine protein phosphatase-like [Sinocyclocheilus anshuiensis]
MNINSWWRYVPMVRNTPKIPKKKKKNLKQALIGQPSVVERGPIIVTNMATHSGRSVLFVCLGNICRSPIAEAVFWKMATDNGVVNKWRIDSAATSTYEIGNPPDHRGQACMKRHGVSMRHVAQQVTKDDFMTFDHILCMDESNLSCLVCVAAFCSWETVAERTGSDKDFETVYEQCVRCCKAFLEQHS